MILYALCFHHGVAKEGMGISGIISASTPRKGNVVTRFIGKLIFKGFGWSITGKFPDEKKAVFIIAPHTSNWDYVIAIAGIQYLGVKVRYLMKSELNVWPFSYLFKWHGGVPVYRTEKTDIIEQCVNWFAGEENVWLGMSPEGTRSKVGKWKTGFLRIAKDAHVPIILVGIHRPTK